MSFSLLSNIPSPSFTQTINKHIEPLNFPECPGVYVMVNRKGEIAYTGKTKNLRQRIHNHVTSSHNKGVEKDIAQHNIKEIMVFCCETELDSIVLERYFIQSDIYRGKHNIQYVSPSSNDFPPNKKNSVNRLLKKSAIGTTDQEEIISLRKEVDSLKDCVAKGMETIEEMKRNNSVQEEIIKLKKEVDAEVKAIEKCFNLILKHFDLIWDTRKKDIDWSCEMFSKTQDICVVMRENLTELNKLIKLSKENVELKTEIKVKELEFQIRKAEPNNKRGIFQRIFKRP
ncbi:putative GIY-YIG superfamily endonuclease [Priestia aryabhattai]|uniref:nucleotide excision repair endonuclease n=1 Tax=Priestia aryabhattai TaxID=412384 RepID=UPI0027E5AA26|nr:nucleotide excision repair endonuclease [Priestia aryabhattai]MDP9726946.1 putative GIY-YIG superfamily endonuclease [Priestia aryabhattai]